MGVPRTAAIEYPYGRLLGQVGDKAGQEQVLLETLSVLENARRPGELRNLEFTWPEEPKNAKWQPPEMSPLIKMYLEEIRAARRG
ncbi:hypothetical protein Desti_3192 [Desulfomonile tiedjei DSM 6799]|uniref:Uncharacterized protein n=2 Tax=Desulfomonile tiedjei TaxID=2358 RepID=I4C8G2_DESTA|nr:hypothetical protein Desti_3192 [Desulfomonile tiedjei DSM 6799]